MYTHIPDPFYQRSQTTEPMVHLIDPLMVSALLQHVLVPQARVVDHVAEMSRAVDHVAEMSRVVDRV